MGNVGAAEPGTTLGEPLCKVIVTLQVSRFPPFK